MGKLCDYMGHIESVHAWIGAVRFQCHFCPARFGSYPELVEHSKRYVQKMGQGNPPPPPYNPPSNASNHLAKITLH